MFFDIINKVTETMLFSQHQTQNKSCYACIKMIMVVILFDFDIGMLIRTNMINTEYIASNIFFNF